MILAVDVAYEGTAALAAGVLFRNWTDMTPHKDVFTHINDIQGYVPGEFYRREMPCILALLAQLNESPEIIIVDGFVYLGHERKAGLGKHLYNELNGRVAVVGVAKKPFQNTPIETEVYRGQSKNPLYVTSIGINEEIAKMHVANMHGTHRIPTLLKRVDQLCRQNLRTL